MAHRKGSQDGSSFGGRNTVIPASVRARLEIELMKETDIELSADHVNTAIDGGTSNKKQRGRTPFSYQATSAADAPAIEDARRESMKSPIKLIESELDQGSMLESIHKVEEEVKESESPLPLEDPETAVADDDPTTTQNDYPKMGSQQNNTIVSVEAG